MNKKGMTIIEMLAVLTLLVLLYFTVFPITVEFLRRSVSTMDEATEKLIIQQTERYVLDHPHQFPNIAGNVFCIGIDTLISENYLGDYLYDVAKGEKYDEEKLVKVSFTEEMAVTIVDGYHCQPKEMQVNFVDKSGANPPKLFNQMIPVVYNSGWMVADLTSEWYNYLENEWANVVLVKQEYRELYLNNHGIMVDEDDILAHFVWIPRFRYKLFNTSASELSERNIEIEFEGTKTEKSLGNNNGEWLTHPAFTFGDENQAGFWVGKFTTTGTNAVPTIRPNQIMLTGSNLSDQFAIASQLGQGAYGLKQDTKLMNNLEWGAIAYFSNSIYGNSEEIWINPNQDLLTGCAYDNASQAATSECETYDTIIGQKASTTGNVYGVYDMSGGVWEQVLGVMLDDEGNEQQANAGFASPLSHYFSYFNFYEYAAAQNGYNRRILGDATGETFDWYNGVSEMPYGNSNIWFMRGATYELSNEAAIFAFSANDGSDGDEIGFRVVIPAK